MEITVADALAMLPKAIELAQKLATIISTNTEMSIDEEIAALEEARMKPSADIAAEADKVA
jgi:hypothetical protein